MLCWYMMSQCEAKQTLQGGNMDVPDDSSILSEVFLETGVVVFTIDVLAKDGWMIRLHHPRT
jgi:hypothetical protein